MSSHPSAANPHAYAGSQTRPVVNSMMNDRNAYYRGNPQPVATAPNTSGYGRPVYNPQFQRAVHPPQSGIPKAPLGPQQPPPPPTYASQQAQAHAKAISARIASTNAAIAAIQSVAPPIIRPVPRNRPSMALAGLPQLPGGDIKGTIKFNHENSVEVVDEVTAQRSAADYSKFLGRVRKERNKRWDAFWLYRNNLNRQILLEENECFKEAQEDCNDFEESDEEDTPRRTRPIVVPYIYHNVGSMDVPRPPSVIMPDPEMVSLRLQAQQNMQAQQQQQQAAQVQHAQQLHAMRQQQMSSRQRAAQQVKQYGRAY